MLLGLINGVGIQAETQIPVIFCYLFVCIPSAWFLTFYYNCGLAGLFYGVGIGQIALTIFYLRIVYNINWKKQIEIIHNRAIIEERSYSKSDKSSYHNYLQIPDDIYDED